MAIDLLNLQPQVISKNLSQKYILCYGAPKTLGVHTVMYVH